MAQKRIVVGLDPSAAARDALRWAVREAARTGASVMVVTAWPERDRSTARDGLPAVLARRLTHRCRPALLVIATARATEPAPVLTVAA